jgi:hypothetical protein
VVNAPRPRAERRRGTHVELIDELFRRPLFRREQFDDTPPREGGYGEETSHADID